MYFYSDKSSVRSEEIVPDLTVKSASSTRLARFPSDLLESSVDPDLDAKDITHENSIEFDTKEDVIEDCKTAAGTDQLMLDSRECNHALARVVLNDNEPLNVREQQNKSDSQTGIGKYQNPEPYVIDNISSDSKEYQSTTCKTLQDNVTFQVTTSTLDAVDLTIPSDLAENTDLLNRQEEVKGLPKDKSISFSENFDPEVEAEMERAYNPTTTTLKGTQGQWQVQLSSASSKSWGPAREVEVHRGPSETGLGISIVGGTVGSKDGRDAGEGEHHLHSDTAPEDVGIGGVEVISGIFIKNVIPDSPAGRTGQLFTGDHVAQVDGTKLISSDQQVAVQAIKSAGNPVKFVVRSLLQQQQVGNPTHHVCVKATY